MAQYQQMTRGKNRRPQEVCYDGLIPFKFQPITLTGTIAIATVQELFPLGVNVKIMAVAVAWKSGIGTPHALGLNIYNGAAAKTTLAPPDNTLNGVVPPTVATAGQYLFNADQTVSVTDAAGAAVFYPTETAAPDQFDAIFPSGSSLALHVSVVASSDTTTLYVCAYGVPYDVNPPNPHNSAWVPSAANL